MESLLSQLNSVPGILGSMVCSTEGQVVGYSFPHVFDLEMMKEAASILADSSVGLETVTGPVGMLDLRYSESRIIVKPLRKAFLLLLCSKAINLQLLLISCSVAARKIEKVLTDKPLEQVVATASAKQDVNESDKKEKKKKARKELQWWPSM